MRYIAIVAKRESVIADTARAVNRSAFTGTDKARVIQTAMEARREWETKGQGPYSIFIGELQSEIVPPTTYEEVPIG